MFGQPGSGRGGGSNYCLRTVLVLLAILMMIAYLLYFFYQNKIIPFQALVFVAWLFSQEDIMPNIGPVTLEKIKAIIDRIDTVATMREIEDLGRAMGIPEEKQFLACRIVEIEVGQRIREEIAGMRADNERLHQERAEKEKKKFNWGKALRNVAASIVGEYDAHNPKK